MIATAPKPWIDAEDDLPVIRTGAPFRCHGDTVTDNLRIARLRYERTVREVGKTSSEPSLLNRRYEIGSYLEDTLEDIAEGYADYIDDRWFARKARSIRESVNYAKECTDEDDAHFRVPAAETWEPLRALANALTEHATAIAELRRAEALAAKYQ